MLNNIKDEIRLEVNMSIKIAGYSFGGPYSSPSTLYEDPGVYVILCKTNDSYKVLDVGESKNMRDRVTNHDRKDCWKKNCKGTIVYAEMKEADEDKRRAIEKTIRDKKDPPCGEK